MNNTYITSDLHIFHNNIVDYCNRPCTKEDHTQWIIDTLNNTIKEDDTVYHLGDLAFLKYKKLPDLVEVFKQINGNWNFLLGNHDKEHQLKELCKQLNYNYLGIYHEMIYKNQDFVLFHYPIESWDKQYYGSKHLHGHLHNNPTKLDIPNRYNVCLDKEFKIYNIEEFL